MTESTRDLELRYGAGTYLKRDLVLVRGEGARVFDEEGKSYIDCIAGIGTASLGHNHPRLVEAISRQASEIISAPELLSTPSRARYQERLLETLPDGFERVFLCNSGTEAIEAALKFARYSTKKPGIVALKHGFHGKTMGALSATAEKKYREPFEPLLPFVHHVGTRDPGELESVFEGNTIGAFIFEAIQGEGGVRPLDKDFVTGAVAIARRHEALVIADEVQCGFGRTGKMWGYEHFNLQPDLACAAKGIAGGVPMGAVALGMGVAELPAQSHTSTFGGNPLACRAALTVLDVLQDEDLVANSGRVGDIIMNGLREAGLKRVREVRGRGLMIGIELKEKAGLFLTPLSERGLLCLLAGSRVLRLLPPLILTGKDASEIVTILTDVL